MLTKRAVKSTLLAARARFTDDDLLPALIFIVLAAFACVTPAQNDTWWHLRSGQQMWLTGAWLTTEPFSHTAHGTPLNDHWWLTQLTFYGVHSLGGAFLLTVFAGACALAAVAGSWSLVRGAWEVRVALLAWLAIATAPEWAIRPQVISLALIVLMTHLVVRGRLHWLPLVCVVWSNFHAMVIFGVGIAGAVAVEALVWSRADAKRALTIAAAAVAAPMISPIGWNYWPQSLTTISVSQELQLQEYRMSLDAASLPFWLAAAALVVLTVLHRAALREWSRADRILLISALGLAVAAATATRNVAFFAVVAAPVLSRFPLVRQQAGARRPARAGAYAVAVVVLLAAAAAVAVQWRVGRARLGWDVMSAETIATVRRCPDPLFNTLSDGGYLMWALPERRIFVDSRMQAYPADLLRRSRAADLFGEYRDLFRDYGIRCAVVAAGSPMHDRLVADHSMELLHTDVSHSVFARRDAAHPLRSLASAD